MSRRIVILGATGYVGRLVARSLMRARVRPVLAGDSAQNLAALGVELGHGLDTAVADARLPDSLLEALRANDVVINLVGPYSTHGRAVAEAAIIKRATYIDCCTEPQFLETAFDELGEVSAQAGVALVPGFGHRFVAGTLAGALAVERTGRQAVAVDIGYFSAGPRGASTGTRAARPFAVLGPQRAWRDGELVPARYGDRRRRFAFDGADHPALALGGSEHVTLPRLYPRLREVGVYAGRGSRTRARVAAGGTRLGAGLPGVREVAQWWGRRPRTLPGPDDEARARAASVVVAVARDGEGHALQEVVLRGPSPYAVTAELLAWAAQAVARDGLPTAGALGPLEAFAPRAVREACAAAGLVEPGVVAPAEPGTPPEAAVSSSRPTLTVVSDDGG